MTNTFELNGKIVEAAKFDFNTVCDLEDYGIKIEQFEGKPMSMVRAYIAISMNITAEEAGKEMEQHMISGHSLESVMDVMGREIDASDFFRALKKTEDEETQKTPKKKAAKAGKAAETVEPTESIA